MREIVGLENRLKNMIALDKKEEPEKIIRRAPWKSMQIWVA